MAGQQMRFFAPQNQILFLLALVAAVFSADSFSSADIETFNNLASKFGIAKTIVSQGDDVRAQVAKANACLGGFQLSAFDVNSPDLGGKTGKASIFMVTGLVTAMAGCRALHSILFVLAVAGAGGFVFRLLTPDSFFAIKQDLVKCGIVTGVSLLAGFLACWFLKIGVVILGAALGWVVSTLILSLNLWNVQESGTITTVVSCLAFAIVAYFLSDTIIIIATAVLGGLAFVFGYDFVADKGFVKYILGIIETRKFDPPSQSIFPILISFAIIALLGTLVQFKTK